MNLISPLASVSGTSGTSDNPALSPDTRAAGFVGYASRRETGPLLCRKRWRPTLIENVDGCAHRITVRWDLRQNRFS